MIQDLLSSVDSHIRIVLLRHGQDSGTINGDVVRELNDLGVSQSEKCADFLKQFSFDQLYCSDHLRAQQTLGIVDLALDMEITVSRKLREVSSFYAMGDIELTKEYSEPVKEFLIDLLDKSEKGSMVLAVTHSHLIRYIISLRSIIDNALEARCISELCEQSLVDRTGSIVELQNASITVVDISKSGLITPRLINCTEHL